MAAAKKQQPGNDVITTTTIELIGVAVFTMLAGINDDMGSVMVVIMWGILLGWLLLHTSNLQHMLITAGLLTEKQAKAILWAHNSGKFLRCFSSALSSSR